MQYIIKIGDVYLSPGAKPNATSWPTITTTKSADKARIYRREYDVRQAASAIGDIMAGKKGRVYGADKLSGPVKILGVALVTQVVYTEIEQ